MTMSTYRQYLTTLRRVPDDIVLATAARDLEPDISDRCLCGWFVREQIARMTGQSADEQDVSFDNTVPTCVESFGGSASEWEAIFYGVARDDAPLIERAFVERVLEAVNA